MDVISKATGEKLSGEVRRVEPVDIDTVIVTVGSGSVFFHENSFTLYNEPLPDYSDKIQMC